jgi:flagellar basal-body rod protein FlgC
MIDSFGISLSGLNAASTRVAAAASNIANIRSVAARDSSDTTGFKPVQVSQVSNVAGGTQTVISEVDPPSVPSFEPGNPSADANGIVPRPNVNLPGQMVELMTAEHNFKANLRAMSVADSMLGSLFDQEF